MSVVIISFFCLLFLSGFFSASETALFSLSSIERKRIAASKDWKSGVVQNLLAHPSKTLNTILIGNMIVNTALTCLFTLYSIGHYSHEWLGAWLLVFTFVLLIGGEVVPKNIALVWNVRLAYIVSLPLKVCSFLFAPFVMLVMFLTDTFFQRGSTTSREKADLSGEEMKTLIEIGREEGVVAEEEVDQLRNIFSFGERKVKEVMIPRTDMISYDIDEGREELVALVKEEKCRYVVLYKNTIDTVVGIIFTKRLLLHPELTIKKLLEMPQYIPELQKIEVFLTNMIVSKCDCAICVDEFGGTAGVISHDEIIHTIFGRLHEEEYEHEHDAVIERRENEYVVEGTISLYELNAFLKLDPGFDAEHYDSLSGFILDHLEEIPQAGVRLEARDAELIIESVDKNRIEKVIVRPHPHE